MKKWLVILAVLILVLAVWYYVRTTQRFIPPWRQPEFGKVELGDIRVPITATGLIEPYERIQVKSEASGEVTELKIAEGDSVQKDDVLAVLKRDDEERAVEKAESALERARSTEAQAKIAVLKAESNIEVAKARVQELEAQETRLRFELDHQEKLSQTGNTGVLDVEFAKSAYNVNQAQLINARTQIAISEQSLKEAQETVKIQAQVVKEASNTLADANERLLETTIKARQDAIVTDVPISRGMLVQSGTAGFTGGTIVAVLADISRLKVVARVDEADYGRVLDISPVDAMPDITALREAARSDAESMQRRSGDVRITVDAFPELTFTGRISRVEPQGRLNEGSSIIQFDVHVEVNDDKRYMLPLGTQAQVEFTVESVKDATIVPAEAVKQFEGQRGVWIKTADRTRTGGVAKRFVPCRFGITDGAKTQVIEVLGGAKLDVGAEVFTKLPPEENSD